MNGLCMNCRVGQTECIEERDDGQGYERTLTYACLDCGEEWEETMTINVTKKGKEGG